MNPRTDIQNAVRDLARVLSLEPKAAAAVILRGMRGAMMSEEHLAALGAFHTPDPCLVGRIDGAFTYRWDPVTRKSSRHQLDACIMSAQEVTFAGMTLTAAHKQGASLHDGEPLAAFTTGDDDEEFFAVWIDAAGNVHADSTGEVEQLRARYARHQLAQQAAAKPAKTTKRAKRAA